MVDLTQNQNFVELFRNSAAYINAFRDRTFVIMFYGECLKSDQLGALIQDFAVLNSLGIRLILVHGARPQINERLKNHNHQSVLHNDIRITDNLGITCLKEAIGTIRMEIEAQLSIGLSNSPIASTQLRVASGNFVIARPYGIRGGIDYQHTGEVRRIDVDAINDQLDSGSIVLLSPCGYSASGEIFNLHAEEVAAAAAKALKADKLIYLMEHKALQAAKKQLVLELSIDQANALLNGSRKIPGDIKRILNSAVDVCQHNVRRVHLLDRRIDGALLQELFTRDGIGTLISADFYEGIRSANIEDVSGILELLNPLEQQGMLVKRSRELLELEINNFMVIERDGMIIACAALYTYLSNKVGGKKSVTNNNYHTAELACLAVHADYQNSGRGNLLLNHVERMAKQLGIAQIFVLSTRTMHWFQERGFNSADIKSLPVKRMSMYNYQRKSKVFIKSIKCVKSNKPI